MPNTLSHERERFRTMNQRQLTVRLRKITDRQKLRNFIQLCHEYGYSSLEFEAQWKLSHMGPGPIPARSDYGRMNVTTSDVESMPRPTVPPQDWVLGRGSLTAEGVLRLRESIQEEPEGIVMQLDKIRQVKVKKKGEEK